MQTVLELQSFQRRGSCHVLVGEAMRGERRVPFSFAVDGETFEAIGRCIAPGDGHRYRLSSQCKWDPFRQQYFSSVTRIEQNRRQLLYFPCSAGYRDALQRLHDNSFVTLPKPDYSVSRPPKMAVHILIVGVFLALCIISLCHLNVREAVPPHHRVVMAAQPAATPETDIAPAPIPEPKPTETLPPVDKACIDAEVPETPVSETEVIINGLPDGYAALTFDDGPSLYTREIVDILCEHNAGATFFFIGLHALKYPEAVKYASDHDMAVGNHSWNHTGLNGKGIEDLRNEIIKTNDYLSSLTNAPVMVFRPPFGRVNDQLTSVVADAQMKIVLWNRDPRDWDVKDAGSIIDYVCHTNPAGGIYILHENELTVQALPRIIQHLRQGNVQITVLG